MEDFVEDSVEDESLVLYGEWRMWRINGVYSPPQFGH